MSIHKPVLLEETIENLNLEKGDTAVDATLGGGGHSSAILKKIRGKGTLIAIDLDSDAIENFKIQSSKFKNIGKVVLVNDNFANLQNILPEIGIEKADAILADLGWSSDQLSGRGMSFLEDEDLDMRLDRRQELSAEAVINDYPAEELERIIRDYGEERYARSIARKIAARRKEQRIRTTGELAGIISGAVPGIYKRQNIHPATRTFQAIRIEVNQELKNLEKFIPEALEALNPGGRLAVISFHSLEDRIVKNIFRQNARGCICPKNFPKCNCGKVPRVKIITRKPIVAGGKEVLENPRSRSAKLRVCEKI